jgi:hypothetical protein
MKRKDQLVLLVWPGVVFLRQESGEEDVIGDS